MLHPAEKFIQLEIQQEENTRVLLNERTFIQFFFMLLMKYLEQIIKFLKFKVPLFINDLFI